jgi:hypothetical protein
VDNKFVTPTGWKTVCNPDPFYWACETHDLDPDHCLDGWWFGVPGASTTTTSFTASYGAGGTTSQTQYTVSYNAQEGLIKACENAEFAAKAECGSTMYQCKAEHCAQ